MPTKRKKSLLSWTKGDTLFVVLVLGVVLSTSWVLLQAFNGIAGTGSTQIIGTIIFKQKVAERKFSSQALWGRLESKSPVYNFDTIRTGTGASAVVTLEDGTQIHLDEETMVGLELQQKAFSVSLVAGKVAAQRHQAIASTTFSLISRGVGVTMENGQVNLTSRAGSVSVQADTQVRVTSGGQTSSLGPDQTATLAEGTAPVVHPQPLALLEPPDQSYVVGDTALQAVSFRWQGLAGIPVTLQVVQGSDFSRVDAPIRSTQGQARIDLAEGSYSWRVLAEDGTPSASRRLVVFRGERPLPIEPQGIQGVAEPDTALVGFSWAPSSDATAYRLEIFDAAKPTEVLRSLTTTLRALSVASLPEGKYLWRAVGLYAFANAELAGPTRAFEIHRFQKLPSPVANASLSQTKARFSLLDKADSSLGWESVPSAEGYEVVIARDSEFRNVVATTRTTTNTLGRPSNLEAGEYYWRVRALTRDLVSDPSAVQRFAVVSSLPLQGLSPRSVIEGSRNLSVTWSDPNHGQRYSVELSQNEGFTRIESSLDIPVTQNPASPVRSAPFPWDRPGAFFWRVKLLDAAGSVLATSPAVAFVVVGGLPRPTLLAPGPLVDTNEVPVVTFRWEPVAGANLYRLALSRTLAGRPQVIYRAETSQTVLNLDRWDLLALDPYVWSLTAVTVDQGRDIQVSPSAAGSFSLVERQPLKAATLRIPQVIYLPAGNP